MTRRAPAFPVAILLAALLATRSGAAQPAKPTPGDLREGELRYKEGLALHQKDREEEALTKFRESYATSGNLHALFAIARTEQLTNHLAEAMRHFQQFVNEPAAEEAGPSGKEAARRHMDELTKQLALVVVEAPPAALVTLDGKALGPAERQVYVLPGSHVLEGTLDGRTDRRDADADAVGAVVKVQLLPAPAPVTGSPPHDEPYPVRQSPAQSPSGLTAGREVAIVLGGVAVVAAGFAVGFGVAANNNDGNAVSLRAGNANTSCTNVVSDRCTTLANASSAARTDAALSTGLYIGGGVVAAGAIVLWLLSPPRSTEKSSLRVVPMLDRTAGGLGLTGSF